MPCASSIGVSTSPLARHLRFTMMLPVLVALSTRYVSGKDALNTTTVENNTDGDDAVVTAVFSADRRTVVTDQAMGARCAVSADFDGDGRLDLVSASSNDNAVSWFQNLGPPPKTDEGGADDAASSSHPEFSIKKKITWSSLGSRIVTVGDVDGDGDVDVVGASYYDSSLRWFENDGAGSFTEHLISNAVNEGQGVTLADLDNDGDPDIVSASSGDNTIAVFVNIDRGTFCEVKQVVDDNAIGARTVIASDLNGDGYLDLASASKDDNSVAWYPNDGTGHFSAKIVISSGEESLGAYSLVSVDIDKDGDEDLVVASNGNDHVSIWRNDGDGNFEKTLVYDNADFVLSVTAVDFDRDGDIDIASASFFDGHINWYENIDGEGYVWKNHTIFVGIAAHYVHHGDIDGDGDYDLIAADNTANTITVFFAETECDGHLRSTECCIEGTEWNGNSCELCPLGTYGLGFGLNAQCVSCPIGQCNIPGRNMLPTTCVNVTGCDNIEESLAQCSCPVNTVLDRVVSVLESHTDSCIPCSPGKIRPDIENKRGLDTLGDYAAWEAKQGTCIDDTTAARNTRIIVGVLAGLWLVMVITFCAIYRRGKRKIEEQKKVIQGFAEREEASRLGTSKFGEAISYIDTLLDEADSKESSQRLSLLKTCLLCGNQDEDKEIHVPEILGASVTSTITEQYIMKEFAGVSKRYPRPSGLRQLGSRSASTYNIRNVRETVVRSVTRRTTTTVECLPEFEQLDTAQKMKLFELLSFSNLQRWDFNIFEVAEINKENTLLLVAWAILCSPASQLAMAQHLRETGATKEKASGPGDHLSGYRFLELDLGIDAEKLCNYLRTIEGDYQDNPYHNRVHAADVVQTLNSLIHMANKTIPFNDEDLFLLLIASVVHDVKHPGKNNSYQVNTLSDLSLDWNDKSVLENEHASHAFKVMIKSSHNHFLVKAEPSKLIEVRKKVMAAVLHTDMTKHFATVAKLKSTAVGKDWHDLEESVQWNVLMYLLHVADISNPAKGRPMCQLWTDRCLEEFFLQGDKERDLQLPISPNCDRYNTNTPDSQIGFINFVVKPAYETLADIIPGVRENVLPVITKNLEYWEKQKSMEE